MSRVGHVKLTFKKRNFKLQYQMVHPKCSPKEHKQDSHCLHFPKKRGLVGVGSLMSPVQMTWIHQKIMIRKDIIIFLMVELIIRIYRYNFHQKKIDISSMNWNIIWKYIYSKYFFQIKYEIEILKYKHIFICRRNFQEQMQKIISRMRPDI